MATKPSRFERSFAIAWGVMLSLCVTGYTFGQSNHHVYLLDALRIAEPEALARDWFTNNTLQYHFLFTRLVLGLEKIRLLETGFFVLCLALAVAMHASWLAIVRRVGGDIRTYLLSTFLYHISGGALGLGVYQFLQDGSFLPSNISAVATLAAIAFWLDRRLWATSICVAIAGLFHVNYALALIGFWSFFSLIAFATGESRDRGSVIRWLAPTALAMAPCFYNVAIAAIGALHQPSKLPLQLWVDVYVHLRHEHHHDPLRWPIALWLSFLWPIPLALIQMRSLPRSIATRRLNLLLIVLLAMLSFAFVFAGIWFVSDTLVQMSLFRFSIFAKLITCVYAAMWIQSRVPNRLTSVVVLAVAIALLALIPWREALPRSVPSPHLGLLVGGCLLSALLAWRWASFPLQSLWRFAVVLALPACLYFAARQQLGVAMPGEDDPEIVELADWARHSTPRRSLFLTPPQDAIFTLEAHRSSVVGFKQVPQLSGELVEWKRRLDEVLDEDILNLPRPLQRTLDAMADRYRSLPESHLRAVAVHYDCDYFIAMSDLGDSPVFISAGRKYFVYRVH